MNSRVLHTLGILDDGVPFQKKARLKALSPYSLMDAEEMELEKDYLDEIDWNGGEHEDSINMEMEVDQNSDVDIEVGNFDQDLD